MHRRPQASATNAPNATPNAFRTPLSRHGQFAGQFAKVASAAAMVLVGCMALPFLSATAGAATTAAPPAVESAGQPVEPTSFGVSPGTITISDGARKAQTGSDVIVFNRSGVAAQFEASSAGDVSSWIRFGPVQAPVTRYRFGAQPGRTNIPVSISIPSDAPNGTHAGVIRLTAAAVPGQSASGVSVTFEIPVAITVRGDQRVGAIYSNLSVLASEVGLPVEIRATVANTGNVSLPISATAEIQRNDVTVARLDTSDATTQALPGKSSDLSLNWDTTDALPGDYIVIVDMSAGTLELGQKRHSLRLEAPGNLVRALTIQGLEVEQPKDGRPLLRGRVTNNGQIAGRVTVSAVLFRSGSPLSSVEGNSAYIAPGQTIDAVLALPLLASGSYRVTAAAELDDYRSPEVKTSFSVSTDNSPDPLLPIVGLGALGAALVGLAARHQSRRNRRSGRSTAEAGPDRTNSAVPGKPVRTSTDPSEIDRHRLPGNEDPKDIRSLERL